MSARLPFVMIAGALILAVFAAAYTYVHRPLAEDSTDLVAVPLSEDDPGLEQAGALAYRGGIDIPRLDQNIGGLSALRWDKPSGRLLALTDDARWVWITPTEQDNRLTSIAIAEVGDLRGPDGARLTGKAQGDSESLTRSVDGGWLIGFERDHRIWRYPALSGPPAPPVPSSVDPQTVLGPLENNNGVETLAGNEASLFMCAEQASAEGQPNCAVVLGNGRFERQTHQAPKPFVEYGAAPTDADMAADGTLYILFRSYSQIRGNSVAIVEIDPEGKRRNLMSLAAPLTVDNFEGIAVREEDDLTFLYIISDDNFSGSQRTLLMKFEVTGV